MSRRRSVVLRRLRAGAGAALAAMAGLAAAQTPVAQDDHPLPWKFTATRHFVHGGPDGLDVNLRWRRDDTSAWVGLYEDRDFGTQGRVGWDSVWRLGGDALPLALLPSLQAATRGFAGGSLALQAGDRLYVQAGIGRTNLRPYQNLNFDPNDAITAVLGWKGDDGRTLGVTVVRDDRLHTGQRHVHLTGQWPLPEGRRLTLDLLRKRGQGEEGDFVRATGFTATLDFPRWFLRAAWDPKQNFSPDDVLRIGAGWRF
jgi:hypothetical protein